MTTDEQRLFTTAPAVADPGLLRRVVRELAAQDIVVLCYLVGLNIAALQAVPGPDRTMSLERVFAMLVFCIGTLLVVRGGMLRHNLLAPLMYRFAIYGTVQLSYFFFANFLPIVNPTSLDWSLYELDLALFGFEPAMAMDAIVTSITSEWFAFFYFSYFFLLAIHVIPILLAMRNRRVLNEFALGMLFVFCIGHTVYMLVPGYGPYKAMADEFAHTLPSGMWIDTVMATVASGGAQKDIFPSLHTAAPFFIALFSYRQRRSLPFRYTWPIVLFFSLNIVIATMFLRWHYIIDVVAGLLLACFALVASVRVTRWELTRRTAARLRPSWPLFFDDRARERSVSHRAPAA
jgi:membrane-associated phospholipid phosphatase